MPLIDLNPFVAELRSEVVAVAPQVLPPGGGVWEVEHINKFPWRTTAIPFAVLTVSRFPRSQTSGVASNRFSPKVDIWYVQETPGSGNTMRTAMEVLLNRFWPNRLTTGQVIDVVEWGYDDEYEPNRILAFADRGQRAGLLRLSCRVGYS